MRTIACCSSVAPGWSLWTLTGGYATEAPSSTTWVWNLHADAHDYSSQLIPNTTVVTRLFATHFGHLSIVAAWFSAALIAGARFSNYEQWLVNPLNTHPLSQMVWSTVYPLQETIDQDSLNSSAIRITSGVFYVWRSAGLLTGNSLFVAAIAALTFSFVCILGGWYHYHRIIPNASWFNDLESILAHHLTTVIGLACLGWAGHLIHVAYPLEVLLSCGCDPQHCPSPSELLTSTWTEYFYSSLVQRIGSLDWHTGLPCITWIGSMNPATSSLYLSDIIHHHLACGVVFLVAGHLYRTQFGIGLSLSELLTAHKTQAVTSWHFQLSINLAILGTGSILAGHLLTALPAYAYLRYDWSTVLSLFVHHAWIGGFFIVGAGAHGAIYLVKEYQLWAYTVVERVLAHRYSIIVHLNWACIFLGFHSFGLYIHNDTLSALGRAEDLFSDSAIVLAPAFGLIFQQLFTPEIYASGSVVSAGVRLVGTADTLVHHVHAFTIHVTTLILLKGVLFARSSRLVADKSLLGFRFP